MAVKDFIFGVTLSAALDSHFKTAFSSASANILKLNQKMQECRDINKAVTEAFKSQTVAAESKNNALRRAHQTLFCLFTGQVFVLASSPGVSRVSR